MTRVLIFGLMFALLVPSATSYAQGKGRGKKVEADKSSNANKTGVTAVFEKEQERIIREWFSNPSNLKGLPPGLAKKETLPPGLQKQLERNGKLPPGLEKKIQPLPHELEIKLPRLPDGRRRIIIAGNVILLDERIGTILDVLRDVF